MYPLSQALWELNEEMAYTDGLFQAFSDLHIEIAQTIAQGDFVVINAILTGTNDGPWRCRPARPCPPPARK